MQLFVTVRDCDTLWRLNSLKLRWMEWELATMEEMKKVTLKLHLLLGKDRYDRYVTADYRYEIESNTILKTIYWNQTV